MGTRADFYVGRGKMAEWLGSIAWDGYPDEESHRGLSQSTEESVYRQRVSAFLASRDDATLPDMGWPWPWDDSGTTDYAYAFDAGDVLVSNYGGSWMTVSEALDHDSIGEDGDDAEPSGDPAEFPDMSSQKKTTFGKRSGIIVVHDR